MHLPLCASGLLLACSVMLTKVLMGLEMLVPVARLPSKLHSLAGLQQRSSTKSSAMEGVIPDSTQLKPHLTFEGTVHLQDAAPQKTVRQ